MFSPFLLRLSSEELTRRNINPSLADLKFSCPRYVVGDVTISLKMMMSLSIFLASFAFVVFVSWDSRTGALCLRKAENLETVSRAI